MSGQNLDMDQPMSPTLIEDSGLETRSSEDLKVDHRNCTQSGMVLSSSPMTKEKQSIEETEMPQDSTHNSRDLQFNLEYLKDLCMNNIDHLDIYDLEKGMDDCGHIFDILLDRSVELSHCMLR